MEESLKPIDLAISPEEKFWGHCSNLQAWVENDYDTRLINKNLAFPLLHELAKRSSKMKEILRREISRRIREENIPVVRFLIVNGLDGYLSEEEIIDATLITEEAIIIRELRVERNLDLTPSLREDVRNSFCTKKNRVIKLNLKNSNLSEIPESIKNLNSLEFLDLSCNQISSVPKWLLEMPKLRRVVLTQNPINFNAKQHKGKETIIII
ncbi:MAG: hypothetical protein ACQERB_07155 [Promethearchaeati archaeon]